MKYWELDDTKTNGNSLEQIEASSQICYLKILFSKRLGVGCSQDDGIINDLSDF